MASTRLSSLTAIIAFIAYVGAGVLQMVAIAHALHSHADWHAVLAWMVAYVVAFVPVLGNIGGAVSAHLAWQWPAALCLVVFIAPLLAVVTISWWSVRRRA